MERSTEEKKFRRSGYSSYLCKTKQKERQHATPYLPNQWHLLGADRLRPRRPGAAAQRAVPRRLRRQPAGHRTPGGGPARRRSARPPGRHTLRMERHQLPRPAGPRTERNPCPIGPESPSSGATQHNGQYDITFGHCPALPYSHQRADLRGLRSRQVEGREPRPQGPAAQNPHRQEAPEETPQGEAPPPRPPPHARGHPAAPRRPRRQPRRPPRHAPLPPQNPPPQVHPRRPRHPGRAAGDRLRPRGPALKYRRLLYQQGFKETPTRFRQGQNKFCRVGKYY